MTVTMEEQLRQIVGKIAEVSPDFDAGSHLKNDLGVDSLRAIEIVFEIERTFGIKIPEEKYDGVESFGDILQLVTSLKS
jgi:acyl carrier protein